MNCYFTNYCISYSTIGDDLTPRKISGKRLGPETGHSGSRSSWLSSFPKRQMLWQHLKLDHDHFLPHAFRSLFYRETRFRTLTSIAMSQQSCSSYNAQPRDERMTLYKDTRRFGVYKIPKESERSAWCSKLIISTYKFLTGSQKAYTTDQSRKKQVPSGIHRRW